MLSEMFVSVVFILYTKLINIKNILYETHNAINNNFSDFEIVIIKQGPNNVFSEDEIHIFNDLPSIRLIQLSSPVPYDIACAAGLENAIGDFVVLFNHETDPLTVIKDTVYLCKSGYDVIIGVANQPSTLLYNFFRLLGNKILKQIDYSLPRNATTLRCLSRRAVNSVTNTGRYHHQLAMRIQKTGYPQKIYSYKLQPSYTKKSKQSLFSGSINLLRFMVYNSTIPLRWTSGIGMLGSFTALILSLYSILSKLFNGNIIHGWSSTVFIISLLFFLQFIMLAFLGEYLGKLLDHSSANEDYSVVFEKNSKIMVNQNRFNVLNNPLNEDKNLVQTGRNL